MSKLVADYMREGIKKTKKVKQRYFTYPGDRGADCEHACAMGAVVIGLVGSAIYREVTGKNGTFLKNKFEFLRSTIEDYPAGMIPDVPKEAKLHTNNNFPNIRDLVYDLNDNLDWCRKDIANLLEELEVYYNKNLKES